MKRRNLVTGVILNILNDILQFDKNIQIVKFLILKSIASFSRKMIILLSVLPFGLNVYSQSYPINTYNGQTVSTCSGTFTDSQVGPPAGNYGNNENYVVTFCSANATTLRFDFSLFNLEASDTLYVYNGPTTSSPLLGKY